MAKFSFEANIRKYPYKLETHNVAGKLQTHDLHDCVFHWTLQLSL